MSVRSRRLTGRSRKFERHRCQSGAAVDEQLSRTQDQNTDDQIREIEPAGFVVSKRRIVCESISRRVAATERPQFAHLLERLERDDVLIVTKLDWLDHNAIDVRATVEQLAADSIRVHCSGPGVVYATGF